MKARRTRTTTAIKVPKVLKVPKVIKLKVVEAVKELFVENGGVAWNGLAQLEWESVAEAVNPFLDKPLAAGDLRELRTASNQQLEQLKSILMFEKE